MEYSPQPFRRTPADHSLREAFLGVGVSLTDPLSSWSGLRCTDGAIFIAFREDDVRDAPEGFRCLLWSPGVIPFGALSRSAKRERYFHCQMAAKEGRAMAFVARGKMNEVDEDAALLAIDVVLQGGEYWATWGWKGYAARQAHVLSAMAPAPWKAWLDVPMPPPAFAMTGGGACLHAS